MKNKEYIEIIKNLLQENKQLKEDKDILESILHSHLHIIDGNDNESS